MSSTTDHATLAQRYVDGVLDGSIPAGECVVLAAKRHLSDLAKATADPHYPYEFAPQKGARVCRFIELLPHTKGKWGAKGERIKLEPWQCFLIVVGFGWLRRTGKKAGKRRFNVFYWEVPRKNGKSALAAGIGNYMLSSDGEFGAEVYCGATSEKQAWEVFGPARLMMQRSPDLAEHRHVEVHAKTLTVLRTGSKFEPVIGTPGDGPSPSCAIVDEYHEHTTPAMHDSFETGMGAREQPIMLIITTAGTNIAGPCHEKHDEARKVLEGTLQRDDLFTCIFGIDTKGSSYTIPPVDGLRRLGKRCNCENVGVQKVAIFWRKAYAEGATTNNVERPANSRTPDAGITLTGPSNTKVSAGAATSNGYLTPIPSTSESSLRSESNGRSETPTKSKPQNENSLTASGSTQSTAESEKTKSYGHSTELTSLSTNAATSNSPDGALSARDSERCCALITAMTAGECAAFCAENAIPQSVFSETLRSVYNEHSITCEGKAGATGVDENGLRLSFPADDWADPKVLVKANPNYDISVDGDYLRAQQRNAMASPAQQAKFKTKHLNVWASVLNGMFNMQDWSKCGDVNLDEDALIAEHVECVGALDLASKIDLSTLQRMYRKRINDRWHYYLFGRYWLPEAAIEEPGPNKADYEKWVRLSHLIPTDGATVDFKLIAEETLDWCKEANPIEVVYDPFNATELAQALQKDNVETVEFIQNPVNFAVPVDELAAAMKDGRFHHDNNPVTTWCFSNVVARPAKKGLSSPIKQKPHQKIDGAIASIMAMARVVMPEAAEPEYQMIIV